MYANADFDKPDTLTEIIKSNNNNHDPDKSGKNQEFVVGAVKPATFIEVTPISRIYFAG